MHNGHIYKRWLKLPVIKKRQSEIEMKYYFIAQTWAKILKSLDITYRHKGNSYTLLLGL